MLPPASSRAARGRIAMYMAVSASRTRSRTRSRSMSGAASAAGSRYTGSSRSPATTSATSAAAGLASNARKVSATTSVVTNRAAGRLPCAGRLVLIGVLLDGDGAAVRLPFSRDSTTTVEYARVGVGDGQVAVPPAGAVAAPHEPVVEGLAQREPGDQVGRRPPEIPPEPRFEMRWRLVEGHPAQPGPDPARLGLDPGRDLAHAGRAGRHRPGRAVGRLPADVVGRRPVAGVEEARRSPLGRVAPLEQGPGRGHRVPARLDRAAHRGQVGRGAGLLERLLGPLQELVRPGVLVDRLAVAGLLGLQVDVEVAQVVGQRLQVVLGGRPGLAELGGAADAPAL